jgi:hypothetical protein
VEVVTKILKVVRAQMQELVEVGLILVAVEERGTRER